MNDFKKLGVAINNLKENLIKHHPLIRFAFWLMDKVNKLFKEVK